VAYTALGLGIWCAVLTYTGWYLGRHSTAIADFDEMVAHCAGRATFWLVPAMVAIVIMFVYVHWRREQEKTRADANRAGE